MERSENPFRAAYWLGGVDARPLSLFRVGLGLTRLHDLANYAVDLRAFVTDVGMLPRGVQGAPNLWNVFDWVGSPPAVAAVFALGCVAVAAFTIGYGTWLPTLISFLFFTSLHTRNLYVTDGEDDLVRNLLFLSLFGDLGGRYSVDARARGRKADVPALGLRFLHATSLCSTSSPRASSSAGAGSRTT